MPTNYNLPGSGQYTFNNYIGIDSQTSKNGLFPSVLMQGGFQEMPTILDRNQIPVSKVGAGYGNPVINQDGWSSGRRRVGMLVHVLDSDTGSRKIYTLIPNGYFGNNGNLGVADWLALTNKQKFELLDPTAIYNGTFTPPATYTPAGGSGTADECWVELVFSSETTSDIVADLTVGGVNLGQTVPAGTNIQELAELLLTKVFYPTYTIPSISITGNYSGVLEVGTVINQALTLNGYENDSGPFTELNILQNSSVISTSSSLTGITIADIASQFGYADPNNPNKRYELTYTDTGRSILLGNNSWSGNGSYSAGLVKKDNKGIDDVRTASVRSTNAPQAAATGFASNIIGVNGQYKQFYGNVDSFPTTSSEVRALPSNFTSINTFVTSKITTTKFTLAIPATKNLVSAVTQNFETITGSFILSTALTQVADAGGNLINYKVYNFSTAVPLDLTVTITLS